MATVEACSQSYQNGHRGGAASHRIDRLSPTPVIKAGLAAAGIYNVKSTVIYFKLASLLTGGGIPFAARFRVSTKLLVAFCANQISAS